MLNTSRKQKLAKQARLNQAVDFKNLFSTGKKQVCRHLAFFSKSNHLQYSRLGLVVAKKSVRKAVKRNQFKRVIRESFRLRQEILFGLDVVVIVYQHANQFNKVQLREILDKEWLRLISFYKKS